MRISQSDYVAILARQGKQPETAKSGTDREAELHAQIIKECMKRGWPFIHNRMDRMSTSTIGAPYFVILGVYSSCGMQSTCSPQVYFIECKTRQCCHVFLFFLSVFCFTNAIFRKRQFNSCIFSKSKIIYNINGCLSVN